MNLDTGQIARNSLSVCPSAAQVMWSTCTSSPLLRALEPYFQRRAHLAKLRRRLGFTRPSQKDAGRIAPVPSARSRIRPTVDTLSSRPLRASMAWMRALPMNGYLRRTSRTALTSLGFQARCRTRRGRVDFGASPRWPPAASAAFHRYSVRRLIPTCASAPASSQPESRRLRYALNVRYRSAASGDTCSSTLKLRYDRMRMDFMFMGRVSIPVGLVVHWRLPDPAPRSAFSRRGVALPGHRRPGARCV